MRNGSCRGTNYPGGCAPRSILCGRSAAKSYLTSSANLEPYRITMPDITRKQSNTRMSQIVTHQNVVYLSGQVFPDYLSGSPSIEEQTRGVLAQIDELLA